MKALITSGGRGTRLRPITHTQNKHLIPIANKPILHYALEHVAEAGITEVGIIVNADSDEVREAIGDGSRWGLKTTYIPQDAPRGLAHCVLIAEDFLDGGRFVFYLGDNMVVGGIRRFAEAFEASGANCHLTVSAVRDPERFGVPEIRDGRIVGIEEKPASPASNFAVAGIYFYDESIFEAVRNIRPSVRGELEISDAHQYLLDHGKKVTWSEITGWWKDTGKPEDLLTANRLVLDNMESDIRGDVDEASELVGTVVIEEGAAVANSVIRGPAIIGERTRIENSFIGPFTSIHDDCVVRNSEIEFSIALARVQILDVGLRIEDSLLGCEAIIQRCREKPRSHRFYIGDQSIVEVL